MLLDMTNKTLAEAATLDARLDEQGIELARGRLKLTVPMMPPSLTAANTSRAAMRSSTLSGSKFAHIASMIAGA